LPVFLAICPKQQNGALAGFYDFIRVIIYQNSGWQRVIVDEIDDVGKFFKRHFHHFIFLNALS